MKKSQTLDPSILLFESVLNSTSTDFLNTLKQELLSLPEDLFIEFCHFPRGSPQYNQMVSALVGVAAVNPKLILRYVNELLIGVFQNRIEKSLLKGLEIAPEFDPHHTKHLLFARFYQIIFLTDLITKIAMKYDVSSEYPLLIKLGYIVCSISYGQVIMYELILPKLAGIFWKISKNNIKVLFESFSQLIINKPEPYLIIIKYCVLDSENEYTEDFVEIILDYLERERRKKNLNSIMLSSLSTLVLASKFNNKIIQNLLKFANKISDQPVSKFGKIELLSAILTKSNKTSEELKDFFENNVSELTKNKFGCAAAIKCFYILTFGKFVDAEELYNIKVNEQEDYIPRLSIQSEDEKKVMIGMSSLLIKYFVNSPFIFESQNFLRCILLHYAQIDMKFFMENIVNFFLESDDDDKFTIFLTCVEAINSEGFVENDEMLKNFNSQLSKRTYSKLSKISENMLEYRFFSNCYNESIATAEADIKETFDKWAISPGFPSSSMVIRSVSIQMKEKTYIPSTHLVKVLPFILKSTVLKPRIWTEMLVSLAATNNSAISKQTMMILERSLEDNEERVEMCSNIIDMIKIEQKPEIVFVCLYLLKHACTFQDTITIARGDDVINNMEAIVFIFLGSNNPMIRAICYELLILINKLLKNDGIYSHFEKYIPAIESNAKHNILLLGLPKRPEMQPFYAEEITIRQAYLSPYMNVWLFFLSELTKIVLYAHYTSIINKLSSFLPCLLTTHFGHMHTGLMAMTLSVATCNDYFDKNIYIYKIFHEFTEFKDDILDYNMLIKVIKAVTAKVRDTMYSLFDTFYFTNYTFVPKVISLISEAASEKNTYILSKMNVLYMLIKSVEGITKVRKAISNDVFKILEATEKYYNEQSNNWDNPAMQEQILFFLQCKAMWLDKVVDPISRMSKLSSLLFIKDLLIKFKDESKMVSYASNTLVSLLKCNPGFSENSIYNETIKQLLSTLVICHEHNYNVLEPLLMKDFNLFISDYIMNCYNENQRISDFFFNTIYNVIKTNSDDYAQFVKYFPALFLVGLYKNKTGSSVAEDFLRQYLDICINKYMKLCPETFNNDLETMPIIECVHKHINIFSEAIVEVALDTISDPDFNGSVKSIVEVIIPYVKNFRLLPNLQICIPNIFFLSSMSPYQFLCKLYKVTETVKKQEFVHIAVIWEELIKGKEHMSIMPSFLFECKNPEIKKDLFIHLISKCPKQAPDLLNLITARLHYSFYAYCEFQHESNFREEMWVIDVVTKSLQYLKKETMPTIVHFSLLFHANYTQTLLKKICKRNFINYNRRTLSKESLRYLVDDFIKAFNNESNGDDLIKEWVMEAMRWTIGSKTLKIATTSLVILNRINFTITPEQFKDFTNSLCGSVAYFLSKCEENDTDTNSFINETLKFLDKFFIGNEQFSLTYISCFFDFVIGVDAYFDKMIPLYIKCKESPVTKKQAEPYLRSAIRPIFNELESDGRALSLFKNLVKEEDCLTDFKYVDAVLMPDEKSKSIVKNLIDNSSLQELNYVLGHYSFMAITASSDLMKRIFTATTMILEKYEKIRADFQECLKTDAKNESELALSSLATENAKINRCSSKCCYEALNTEINKLAIVSIYKIALAKVTQSEEAVEYICEVAKIDPMIATSTFILTNNYISEAKIVIDSLNNIMEKSSDIVSLTTCETLEDISNLLNEDSRPKIQPFTSSKEMIELISKKQVTRSSESNQSVSFVDNISKRFAKKRVEVERTKFRRMPSSDINKSFTKLNIPSKLINTDIDQSVPKTKVGLLISMDEFMKLGQPKSPRVRTITPF